MCMFVLMRLAQQVHVRFEGLVYLRNMISFTHSTRLAAVLEGHLFA